MTLTDERRGAETGLTTSLTIPGVGVLEYTRDASGTVVAISGGGRVYLRVDPDGVKHWDGLCSMRELRIADGMVRKVRSGRREWTENYRWEGAALVEVDGVQIRRDDRGRVIACLSGGADPAPPSHRWLYSHLDGGLVHISGPLAERSIAATGDGRVRSWRQGGVTTPIAYDAYGHRVAPARSTRDHVDAAGRCWATFDRAGRLRHVYLWEGIRCLARLDGPVGSPLSAVFSLDPSATPVRVVTPDGVHRFPRDAYGEGLLALDGVPGLFGGQVCEGLVHLPLRRLDPRTGTFCEPDPCDGFDEDPRRRGYEGALPVEPDPESSYEVCRGDPVGRADPTGGVSAGLIVSDLTWSFQNNVLTFFGVDGLFNLLGSLVTAPFLDPGYFGSDGLSAESRRGGFGVRRDGVINLITGGRAFTTQHIVWTPDSEFEVLERGEVFDPGGTFAPSHYGTVLAVEPAGLPRALVASMSLGGRAWVTSNLPTWNRHGGLGVPVAPGALTPWFPAGGLHFSTAFLTRKDTACTVTELSAKAVQIGDLEPRTFLTRLGATGLAQANRVLASDGTTLDLATVVAIVSTEKTEKVQLDHELTALGSGVSLTQIATAPTSSESLPSGAPANSLNAHGTKATYAATDLVRLTATGGEVTVARISALEAKLPLERPLPSLTTPIEVTLGVVAGGRRVFMSGDNLQFRTGARPAEGTTAIASGGGTRVAVKVGTHPAAANEVTIDVVLPTAIKNAANIQFAIVTAGAKLGTNTSGADATAELTYTPFVAGAAPDGGAAPVVVHCTGAGVSHARVVPATFIHDVIVLDRTFAGATPWTVERFAVLGAELTGFIRSQVTGLAVPEPDKFAAAPGVFLSRVTGEPPTAAAVAAPAVDVAAGVALTKQPSATPLTGLEPGRPMLVGTRAAVLAKLRVTVAFDRSFDLSSTGLAAVGVNPVGRAYEMEVRAADQVVVRPRIDVGGTPVDVAFPRFAVGDIVAVTGPNPTTWHRVTAVSGGALTLADGPALVAAAGMFLHQSATDDPSTGGPFLAIDGTRTGSGPTSTATFSVWSAGALRENTVIAVIDGGVCHPATIASGDQAVELTFSEAFDLAGVDVATMTRQSDAFFTSLGRDGGVLLLESASAASLQTGPGTSIVAVALEATPTKATGTMGSGTLLVPESETTELDRGESLANHELEHTLQYAKWGPLWFNLFPMLALELPGILATDVELPEYSAFVNATMTAGSGSQWELQIPNPGALSIAVGNELQVLQAARRAQVKVVSISGTTYSVSTVTGVAPTGDVSVRKQMNTSSFDGWFNFFDLLTHGGLLNFTYGWTWGQLFWLVGKAGYGLGRAIFGSGDLYAAVVADSKSITLSDDAGKDAIRAEGRIVVRQGDNTVVRAMTKTDATISLTEEVSFTGGVQVAMYDTHDADNYFDWYDYFPATIPDAANPARIQVQPLNGTVHTFAVDDRVQLKYRDSDFKTDVLAVSGDIIEILDPITVVGDELSVRVAKVGQRDPLGNLDSSRLVETGMGWMKWVFDPYGQIDYAVDAEKEWAQWLLRVMRWILGTQNFSLLPFGYVWWRRLFTFLQDEHRAEIEQQASEQSGELYSPLGRLTGEHVPGGFASSSMVVGDVVRYRYWPNSSSTSFVTAALGGLDAPGVNYSRQLRIMPNREDTAATSSPPNGTTVAQAVADPGNFVAGPFADADDDPATLPNALGFLSTDLGQVPVGPRIERTMSSYVAFSRAGNHRVTTNNGIGSAQRAVDLHEDERQPLFFDITATDVTVRVAGQSTAEGSVVTLVPFQKAAISVEPNGSRVYRTAVTDPAGSPVVRLDGSTLVGVATGTGEPVEVSRFYAQTAGKYGSGGLAFAGAHLSRDLDVPVRRFTVDVVTTVPLRDAALPDASQLPSLAVAATGFILVPAPIVQTPKVTTIAGSPPAAGSPDPVTKPDNLPDAETFLTSAGATFAVNFPTGSPTGQVVMTVLVGTSLSTSVPLTCTFDLV